MTNPSLRRLQLILWSLLALGALGLIAFSLWPTFFQQTPVTATPLLIAHTDDPLVQAVSPEPLSLTPLATETQPPPEATPAPPSTSQPIAAVIPSPTAVDGSYAVIDLVPDPRFVGWVSRSQDGRTVSSFPDYSVYAGRFQNTGYLGAIRFDLNFLAEAGPALAAELVLVGLNDERQGNAQGTWTVDILADDRAFWETPAYEILDRAPAAFTLARLTAADLRVGRPVRIPLPPETLRFIEGLRYRQETLTVRVRGPEIDGSLFGFDGGVGAGSQGNPPHLFVSTGPPAPTPTPFIVTATSTPENVLTAAAQVAEVTRIAQTTGTPTPTPFNMIVSRPDDAAQQQFWIDPAGTPVPIVVPTEPPDNLATAVARVRLEQAIALTTGTPTPLPPRYVTATPTATPVILVATPTPENVVTLAAQLVTATADAIARGTPTPLPPNAIIITPTPRFIVVTPTPFPANFATAQVLAAQATVQTILTGTPTPTPVNQVTATPLPLLIPVSAFTPTPTPQPTLQPPTSMPPALRGKILFWSDRSGATALYALDPATGTVYSVTQTWPYAVAQKRLGLAPDGRTEAIVAPDSNRRLQIQLHSFEYGDTRQITTFDATSYDPAWSPTGEWIAFVSTAPGNDEIYVVSPDGAILHRLTHNTWEWDKHPSWSPDGSQIVFWSNRETGRRQLWLMAADGSGQHNISNNAFNDWDPIWIP